MEVGNGQSRSGSRPRRCGRSARQNRRNSKLLQRTGPPRSTLMARYFLDTNHLSHALHPRSHLRDRFTAECRKGHVLATNWFVVCEIEAGIAQTARPEKNRSTLSI